MGTLPKYGFTTLLYLLLMSAAFARSDVLVIVNDNSADSVAIGEYYAQARDIAPQYVVHVRVPNQFFISWIEFQSLRDQILRFGICPNSGELEMRPAACTDPSQPIYTADNMVQLTQQSPIKHIVLTRGVPTRMTVDGSTLSFATEPTSVDNYLRYWLARHFTQDVILNFRERADVTRADDIARWRKYMRSIYPPHDLEYIVGRIDGLDVTSARALVDRTLRAEHEGLYGKLYSNTDQSYPWHFAHGLLDETRPECADETTAGHYLNFAQNSAQGKIPQHCSVAIVRGNPNEAMPGVSSGRQPLVDDAVMYLGHLDGQTAEGGFNTLLNWRKNATCTSTLCSTASDPAACRAASTDPFREIDTRCVGVASGFLSYNYTSYSVTHFGSWPTGWAPRTTLENDVPRIDAVGADASGSAWFDRPDEPAGANCYSYSGGILGTSTVPCRAKIYLGLQQNLGLTGLTPTAPPQLRLKFSTRGDSLTAPVAVQAHLGIYYRNPAGVVCPAGTSPQPATSPTQCLQTVTNTVTVTNATQWQLNEFTVIPVAHPASPQFDRMALTFVANSYVGRIGLDTISVVPTGGTELVRNGSFDGGHLQASDGDYAANFLDRLGGVAYWGSLSHHESGGHSFHNIALRSLHFLARGMTLGEAVWLGEKHNSGILYGDPLYSPTSMRMLALRFADQDGRFVISQPLRAEARNGADPSTREVHFSVCRGRELFQVAASRHPAALRCDRNGGWQDLPISMSMLTGTTTATSILLDPTAPIFQQYGDYTLRMRVTGTNPATGLTQTFNDYYPVKHRYSDAELATLWIEGTVTEGGRPLPGVAVTISSSGASPRTNQTDVRGRYSIGSLFPGTHQVTASYTGCTFTPVSLTLTTAGGTAALSCTPSGSAIAGRITINGTGVPGVRVAIQGGWIGQTGTDGSYRSPTLAAGSYTVSPTLQGWVIQPQTVTVTAGQVTVQDFTATPRAGQIQGLVREKGTLLPVAGIEIYGVRLGGSEAFFAYTDVNGRFVQGGLAAGTFELSTPAPDYIATVPITASVGTLVNMEVEPWNERKVSGFVFEFGTVRSGQTVTLRRLPNGAVLTTTTDTAGYYVFNEVVDGAYEVRAQTPTQVYPARQVQVDRNSLLNIDFGE